MHNQEKRPSLTRFNSNVYLVEEDKVISDTDLHEENKNCFRSCFCFNGFFWCGIGLIYFFILLPTGLLLLIFGFNNSHLLSLCLGTMVILLSTCGMPAAIFGCRWWRRNRKQRRRSSVVIGGAGAPSLGGKMSLVHNEQRNVSIRPAIQPIHSITVGQYIPNTIQTVHRANNLNTVLEQGPNGTILQRGIVGNVFHQNVGPTTIVHQDVNGTVIQQNVPVRQINAANVA